MHAGKLLWAIGLLSATGGADLFLQDAAEQKRPVPDAAEQKEQETLIRKIFKDEYAKTGPGDKKALAKKLLKQANETKDDITARFVLLRETRDLAAEGNDSDTSIEAIDLMAAEYQIEPFPMKTAALVVAGKAARSAEDLKRVAATYLKLAEDAMAADEYQLAAQSAGRASVLGKAAKFTPLVVRAEARSKEIAEVKAKFEGVKKAREVLASNADDPAANTTVGQYTCIAKGEWAAGLPLLAKGTEGRLRELARADLSGPTVAGEQLSIADGWWDLAQRERGKPQEHLRQRALYWYEQAEPQLTGLQKVKVNQRLMSGTPSWMNTNLFAHWKMDEGLGDVITDSSGNKRNGKIEGATWVKGQLGGALYFNGTSCRVHIDAGELAPPWTAVMWVRREDAPNSTARLTDSAGGGGGTSLRMEQTSGHRVGITKYMVIDHAYNYTAPTGAWAHLTFVGTDKSVTLFADGAVVGALDQPFPLSVDKLGSRDAVQPLKAALDDVRIYTRALSPNEIGLLYQHSKR